MRTYRFIIFTVVAVMLLQGCSNKTTAKDKTAGNQEDQAKTVAVTGNPGNNQSGGGTTLLTKEVFLKRVWDYNNSPKEWKFLGDKPAMIDFYADWCGPCRMASPILEKVAVEYAGKIDVYKIDTQKERELAAVFGIQGIPAFLYIPKNGKPFMTSGIARTEADTRNMFIENINKILLVEK